MPENVLVGDDMPAEPTQVVEPTPEPAPAPEPAPEPEGEVLLAGKFKDVGELEKSYTELSKKIGDQGNRLGQAEEERSLLLKQLDSMQAQTQAAPVETEKVVAFEQQLEVISQQIEDGEISIGEGTRQAAKISALMAQDETLKGIKAEQSQAAIDTSRKAFAEANPDFFELQASGELELIKAQLPGFHDDVSAYYAAKTAAAVAGLETARAEGVELGKAEMAKIAGGDSNTQKVLQSGGKSAEQIGRKAGPMSPNEIRESGLAALQNARGG